MKAISNRKGVALIVVMLIIISVSAIALVSLRTTRDDLRQMSGFTSNRQAAQGAHSAGLYLQSRAGDDAESTLANQNANGIIQAMEGLNGTTEMNNAIDNANSATSWYYTEDIAPFSGMNKTLPTTTELSNNRLKGDLARPTQLVASAGNLSLIDKPVAGFSDGNAFCNYTMNADAYALIGRAVPVREDGSNKYYLLSDLNARTSGFKREMGLIAVEPLPCQQ